ncbi:MAG: protein kinase [Deltaproteobacteria bacterium]|nr:protein kinase [Deltaproteobacteria bacterium]
MLCYRCGSHVPDGSGNCPTCGQSFASGGLRQATGTFSRRKLSTASIDGAPYKTGDVISNRYTIRDTVGQGPVGFVFRAHDKEVDVEVALKSVSPKLLQTHEERRAFARELKGARKLNHNNIARVYEEGEHNDRPYFTSQFLDGLSLRKIIDLRKEKGQFFRLDEVEPILAQLANALDEAHKLGIVHGDLKPENVLVLPDLLKVTDVSLGMAMPRLPFVNAQKTRKADRYCAPEFVTGGEVSSAVDVYALGAILGEMMGGALPEGGEIPELRTLNTAVTPELEALYRRAVNENPAARFSRAGALSAEIAMLTGGAEDLDSGSTVPLSRQAVATAMAAQSKARPSTDPGRKTSVSRRPPPPPVMTAALDPETTPPAIRPPPLANAATAKIPALDPVEDSGPNVPPPVADPQQALPTKVILSNVVDANGAATEEPTQVVATDSIPRVPTPPPFSYAKPSAPMPIARPLPQQSKTQWAIPLLMVVGLLAGVGGGWLYLQHQKSAQAQALLDEQKAELERQRKLDEEDAGRLKQLEVMQIRNSLATDGGEVALQGLTDGGTKLAKFNDPPPATSTGGSLVPVPHPTTGGGGAGGCPDGMASISAGDYLKGYKSGDQLAGWDEMPLSKAHTEAYCIDLYEYPNQAGQKPSTGLTYAEAKSACEGQGKRLCSEDEWERACKGPSNTRFAWGETNDKDACNTSKTPGPTGDHPRCKSGYGVYDLSGNAAEWTTSRYSSAIPGKAVKGASGEAMARCAGRRAVGERSKESSLGFRCCKDGS